MNNELEKTEQSVIEMGNTLSKSQSTTSTIGIVLDGKYEIRREIARGGMGIVYEAYHKILERRVAIKIISSDKIESSQLRRFQKEVLACVNLSHPNVIKIYDAGIYNNNPYIVMEYIDGVDICKYVAQHDKNYRQQKGHNTELGIQRDWKLCAKLIYKTALALEYIHKQNMLHRDIKPSNILVQPDGTPIIIDLGLVKFQSENNASLTRTGELLGTLQYMPIEQAQGKHHGVDVRSDIYSLGLVLYELLTGKMAYSGENTMEICYKIMSYYPPLPKEINPQIPEELEKITMHAIEKKKEKRYVTAQDFADALKKYLYDNNAQPTPKNNNSKKRVRLQWNKKYTILGIVLIIVIISIIFSKCNIAIKKEVNSSHTQPEETEVEKVKTELEEVKTEYDKFKKQDYDSLVNEIGSKKNKLNDYEQQSKNLEKQQIALKEKIEKIKTKQSEIDKKLSMIERLFNEKKYKALKDNLNALKDYKDYYMENYEALKDNLNALKDYKDYYMENYEALKDNLNALKESKNKTTYQRVQIYNDNIKSSIEIINHIIISLGKELQKNLACRDRLEYFIQENDNKIKTLNIQIENLEKKLPTNRLMYYPQIQRKEEERNSLKNENEKSNYILEKVRSVISNIKNIKEPLFNSIQETLMRINIELDSLVTLQEEVAESTSANELNRFNANLSLQKEKCDSLQKEINEKEIRVKQLEDEMNKFERNYDNCQKNFQKTSLTEKEIILKQLQKQLEEVKKQLKNYNDYKIKLNAKLAAEAGLKYAISQLRKDFGGTKPIAELGTGSWWCQKQNTTINNNNSEQTGQELFDNAAAEIRLDALHKKQDSITNDVQVLAVPSYCVSNKEEITKNGINDSESIPVNTVPKNSPRNISGVCGNTDIKTFNPSVHFPFTLKIVDTTSQFPLNTHVSQNQMNQLMGLTDSNINTYDNNAIEIVGSMLDCLSAEVAKLSAWQGDAKGPLHGLGKEIIRKRNSQKNSEGKCCGFLSKYDIVGNYGGGKITLEDLSYIWDYITVQPTWKEMAVQNIYRQIAPTNGTEEEYRIEYRCPVNINTASYPVLMAVLQGISIKTTPKNITIKTTIDSKLANEIARNIIAIRSGQKIKNNAMTSENDSITFKTWTAFNYFIDVLNEINSSDKTLTDETWGMIKANFNPNVHLKKTNPDLTIYQNVTKPELLTYTTEFCFFPLGYFEITSLGEQYDDKGNILSSYNIGTTAHIYNTLYQTSQYDFEGGASGYQTVLGGENVDNESVAYNPRSIASRISKDYKKAGNTVKSSYYGTGYNAFTLGNNIYKNSTELQNASKLYGAITPGRYHLSNVSGNENIQTDKSGNTLHTGSTTLDSNPNAYVFQENFSGDAVIKELKTVAFPSPNKDTGLVEHKASYLFSDGLYLQPNMQVQKYDISKSNFPPIHNNDPLENKGTILFWFKINNQWNDTNFHTVFLSNQKKEGITIQREIKFKVEIPDKDDLKLADTANDSNISSSTKQFLRKLTIEFVNRVTGNNLKKSKYAYKETKRTVVFNPCKTLGIHAQEWYHLAVRWQDAKREIADTNVRNTTNGENNGENTHLTSFIVLCGNFYTAQDNLVRNNGSQLGRIYDTEKTLVTSNTEKTLVTSNTKVTQKTNNAINGNCFFIGSPDSSNTPYMTIDDFRISALCENTIDDANYFPSRVPYPTKLPIGSENINCYAIYQGRMKLPTNIPTEQKSGSITSFAWTCYGDSSLRPHYTTYTKEYEEIDFEKAFNEIFKGTILKGTRFGSKFNYKAMKNKNVRFENWIILKIFDDGSSVTYQTPWLTTNDPDIYWRTSKSLYFFTLEELAVLDLLKNDLNQKLAKDGGKIRHYGKIFKFPHWNHEEENKDVDKFITLTDPNLTKSYSAFNIDNFSLLSSGYPGCYSYDRGSDKDGRPYWNVCYLYDVKFENIDDLITYYISKWNTAKSYLLQPKERTTIEKFQTYSSVNDCIVPKEDKAKNLPYIFTDKIDSWVYEIVFPASTSESSNNNQVFNNAIIDDVTCFYLLDQPDISEQ